MREQTIYYKEMLSKGLHFQDFVIEELYKIGLPIISYSSKEFQNLIGENKAGIEIKLDRKFRNTNNLYIEFEEKSNPTNSSFVKSGILRNDNTWLYLIGDYQTIYIFSKKQLIILLKHCQLHPKNKEKLILVLTPTSKGMLLPLSLCEKYCIKTINTTNEINSIALSAVKEKYKLL